MAKLSLRMKMKKWHIAILSAVVVLVAVFVALGIVFEKRNDSSKESTSLKNETIETKAEKTTVEATTEKKKVVIPDELQGVFSKSEFSEEELEKSECQQLIVVDASGESKTVRFFELRENEWCENTECESPVLIGKNGVAENKKEGDRCTPLGFYKIGSAFYANEKPDTKLDSFQITEESYWVDDPDSDFYNKYVVGTENKDWNSAERMIEYNGYRYGFVVDYNVECIKGAGSAIFFHIGSNPTAGCVATSEEVILKYLSLLDKNKNPYVLIY